MAAVEFLKRTDLKGAEVPTMVEVMNWLHSFTTDMQPPQNMGVGSAGPEVVAEKKSKRN